MMRIVYILLFGLIGLACSCSGNHASQKVVHHATVDSSVFDDIPKHKEEMYISYLKQLLCMPNLSIEDRARTEYYLKMAQKNRIETVATDFSFTTREGKRMKLSQFKAEKLVLVFYDPECPHCGEILERLYRNPRLQQAIAIGKAKVLAVYTEGNRKLWEETKEKMPIEWSVAIDESKIVERDLYDISAMPMVYLLDNEKRVIIKDAKIE